MAAQTRGTTRRGCDRCGAVYDARNDSLARGMGLFCSRKCYAEAKVSRVTVNCANCGKGFEVEKGRVEKEDRGKYCSPECYHADRVYETRPLAERFWEKVKKADGDGCWEWTGYKNQGGYGEIGLGSRTQGNDRTHRVSWKLTHGDIPDDLQVLHTCDNRGCVRPNHLFLGTNQDNIDDKVAKQRHFKGETAPMAKLTDDQARSIRTRFLAGEKIPALAKEYGVHYNTAFKIAKGERWKHVTNDAT